MNHDPQCPCLRLPHSPDNQVHDKLCPHTDVVKELVKPTFCSYCSLIRKVRQDERHKLAQTLLIDDGK